MTVSPQVEAALRAEQVRADFVPASDYVSAEFAQLELERLWPRVWQLACREEEIAAVGGYVTHDIGDQSIIVVRQSATWRASTAAITVGSGAWTAGS